MVYRKVLWATRYHHWQLFRKVFQNNFWLLAQTESGIIMSLQHKTKPIYGVQFHPESVMTEGGYQMIANWLETLGVEGALESLKA